MDMESIASTDDPHPTIRARALALHKGKAWNLRTLIVEPNKVLPVSTTNSLDDVPAYLREKPSLNIGK